MPKLSKKILIPMAAVAIVGAGAYGATQVSAASNSTGTNPQTSLIQKLADTFHVDKSKVQTVFDQNRKDNEASRETQYEARLSQAVTNGNLTSAQKDLIIAEHKKLVSENDANKASAESSSSTRADRKAAMSAKRTEITTWAKANAIDAKWLMGGGIGHNARLNRPGTETNDDTAASSPSASPQIN
jgi:hypothetical protein